MNQTLAGRILLLIRRDLFTYWRSVYIGLISVGALSLAIFLLAAWQGNPEVIHGVLFPLLFIFGAFVISSVSFNDMHRKESIHHFLMLPASAGEKLVSRLLFVGPIYFVIAVALYTLSSVLGHGLGLLLFSRGVPVFIPFQMEILQMLLHILVLQSIFFLGSTWFRKNQLLKTVLTLVLFSFFMGLWMLLSFRIVFWDYFDGLYTMSQSLEAQSSSADYFFAAHSYQIYRVMHVSVRILYWGLLAPFCWIVSWFRIKEAEVHNGV